MIEECLPPPYVFRDGREERNEPLAVFTEFDFPAPVGKLTLCNVGHEEARLMPMYLKGKGLKNSIFFIGLDERIVEALRVFRIPTAGRPCRQITGHRVPDRRLRSLRRHPVRARRNRAAGSSPPRCSTPRPTWPRWRRWV